MEVLNAEVEPIYCKLSQGYTFIQDNTSIYIAKKVKEWFQVRSIKNITDWPPYSPDLNPIEYIWWILKKRVFEIFPEITKNKSESEYTRQQLESVLQAAWDIIDKESFDILYQSIPRRITACIKADGWHTKY